MRTGMNHISGKALIRFAVLGFSCACTAAPILAQANKLVNVNSDGEWANNDSYYSIISDDGRFITFQSYASNLAGTDTNNTRDIFYRDVLLGTTELVSVATNGNAGNAISLSPDMSGSGRYVAFCSIASNIVSDDTNGNWDIFVRDMQTGTTERVSMYSDGSQATRRSDSPSISSDGRYVSFQTLEPFDPADTNGENDVYVHDRVSRQTILVSTNADGTVGNGDSLSAQLSDDATRVMFLSSATNLVMPDFNDKTDVYVKNMISGEVIRANVSSNGAQANDKTEWPSISGDGSVVVFSSRANNLVDGDSLYTWDLFAHFTSSRETVRISVRPDGGEPNSYTFSQVGISWDGRYVAFVSPASDIVDDDTNPYADLFVRDLVDEVTMRAVFGYGGNEIDGDLSAPDITADGRFITYTAEAENLAIDDGNGQRDIYLVDQAAALYYTHDPLLRGTDADFEVYAADEGETVYYLYSLIGVGNGPCVPQLGGLCLDIRKPLKILGSAVADGSGYAVLTVRIPNNTPLVPVYSQAVARRGTGGADSVKSHTQRAVVE